MTVTISRLYDNHNDAQQAVRRLEAAGVPYSEISIVANNSDSWFNTDKKVDRDRDGVDDRAEGAGKGAGIGAGLGGTAGLLAGLGLLAIPGLGPVVAAGRLARPLEQRPAVLSVRSRRLVFRQRMLTPTPRASAGVARWCQREWRTPNGPVSIRYWMTLPSTCVTEALRGKRRGGNRSMLAANPMALKRFGRNGPCTAVDFVKPRRPASAGLFFSTGRFLH